MKERLSELVDDGHLQVVRGGWCPRPSTRPCSEAAQDLGGCKAASAGTQAAFCGPECDTHAPRVLPTPGPHYSTNCIRGRLF